jgi:hypothetical protein
MALPAHFVHDLDQRGAVLALKQGDHLSGLAALARPGALLFLSGLFGFGRVLGGRRLLGRLTLGGRTLGGVCATLGLLVGLRLRFHLGLRRLAQSLESSELAALCEAGDDLRILDKALFSYGSFDRITFSN